MSVLSCVSECDLTLGSTDSHWVIKLWVYEHDEVIMYPYSVHEIEGFCYCLVT